MGCQPVTPPPARYPLPPSHPHTPTQTHPSSVPAFLSGQWHDLHVNFFSLLGTSSSSSSFHFLVLLILGTSYIYLLCLLGFLLLVLPFIFCFTCLTPLRAHLCQSSQLSIRPMSCQPLAPPPSQHTHTHCLMEYPPTLHQQRASFSVERLHYCLPIFF